MTAHEYFDNDYDNINEDSIEEIRKEIRKEVYNDFMTDLDAVYNVVSALPKEIQLDVFINMMRDI